MLATLTASATWVAPARAQQAAPAPDREALTRARQAWANADFDLAPGLYEAALQAGRLPRNDVVDVYTHMASALAISGKKRAALGAFRTAAMLDPRFKIPPEAGKIATALAESARRDAARTGPLSVTIGAQDEVAAGAPFGVDVALTPDQTTIVTSIGIEARDSLTGRSYVGRASLGAAVHFEIPARLTLPDAVLLVRVRARDAHDNELAVTDKRVHVELAATGAEVARSGATPSHATPNRAGVASGSHAPSRDDGGGGFWGTAWPYVLGGAALAAGGAAAWFATRPTTNVDVGVTRVDLVH